MRQTKLEVCVPKLARNFQKLRKRAGRAELLVVLKSDAYGHGAVDVAKNLERLGSGSGLHGFGVANVEEGIELRRARIRRRVYVMSGIQHADADLVRCLHTVGLVPVVSSLEVLADLAREVERQKRPLPVHLKFNTGMNRLGLDASEVPEVLRIIQASRHLRAEGLMSHFAAAEHPKSGLTRAQARRFAELVEEFGDAGVKLSWIHMENSPGLKNHCFSSGNLSRVGLHLYGLGDAQMEPVARWTAQVYQVRALEKGAFVGYGPLYRAKKKMKMAVLGVGYADGYRRLFSNRAQVLIHGKRCPVIGAVSMDLTAVDVSRVPQVTAESRAVLLGSDGRDRITAEEMAKWAETIPYEILTGIQARVPRVITHG